MRLPSSNIQRIFLYAVAAGLGTGLLAYGIVVTAAAFLPDTLLVRILLAILLGTLIGACLVVGITLALRQVAYDLRVYASEILEANLPEAPLERPRRAIASMRETIRQSVAAVPRSVELPQLASNLAATPDLQHALSTAVTAITPHIPVQGALLLLLDAERGVLTPASAWGQCTINTDAILDVSETAIGRALYEQRVALYAGTQIRDLVALNPGPDAPALIGIPMHVAQQPFGVLGLLVPADYRLNDEQRTFMRSVAALLTLTAQGGMHRRLFQRENDRVAAFEQLGSVLGRSDGLEQALAQVLRSAARVTDSDHGSLLLLEPDELNVRFRMNLRAGTLLPISLATTPILKHGLAGWALRERRADIVEDTERDTRWLPTPGLDAMRSVLVVPLLYGERAFGVLTLADPAPRHYSRRSLALVSALAAYAVTILARMQFEAMIESKNAVRMRRLFEGRLANADLNRMLGDPQQIEQLLNPHHGTLVVLVAGLRGLERAASSLPPTTLLDQVISPTINELVTITQEYQGYVAHHDEVGLLAVFGYPLHTHDDRERSLHAASAMRVAARRLRGRWQANLGCNLGISFGVACGDLIAGVVGDDTAPTLAFIGTALQEAQRLQQLARPDEVLVSDHLAQSLATDAPVEFEPLTPMSLTDGAPMRTIYRLNAVRSA